MRNLLIQEEVNGNWVPHIDLHVYGAIIVCGINAIFIGIGLKVIWEFGKIIYKNLLLFKPYIQRIFSPCSSMGQFILIISTISSAIMLILLIKNLAEELEHSVSKIKEELEEKNKKIEELEKQLEAITPKYEVK